MIYIYITLISCFIGKLFSMFNRSEVDENGLMVYKSKRQLWSEVIITSLPFMLISSFRYYVGTDYAHYSKFQIPAVLLGREAKVEPLYRLVIKLGNFLYSSNYQVIFIITTMLIVIFSFLYIFNRSNNIPFSILLFTLSTFFNFSMNGMRQAIATAIFLFATKYIVSKKPIRYFIWIIIAMGFHSSAMIFLPIYFIRKFKLTNLRVLLYFLSVAVLYEFKGIVFFFINKFGIYTEYLGSYYGTGNNKILVLNILMLCLVLITVFIKGWETLDKDNLNIDVNILLYFILIQVLIEGVPNSSRVLLLLLPIAITLIPNFISEFKELMLRYLASIVMIGYLAYYFVINILVNNFQGTLPYMWWLFWK